MRRCAIDHASMLIPDPAPRLKNEPLARIHGQGGVRASLARRLSQGTQAASTAIVLLEPAIREAALHETGSSCSNKLSSGLQDRSEMGVGGRGRSWWVSSHLIGEHNHLFFVGDRLEDRGTPASPCGRVASPGM